MNGEDRTGVSRFVLPQTSWSGNAERVAGGELLLQSEPTQYRSVLPDPGLALIPTARRVAGSEADFGGSVLERPDFERGYLGRVRVREQLIDQPAPPHVLLRDHVRFREWILCT